MVTPGSGGGSRKRTTRHLAEALPQPTQPARRPKPSSAATKGACRGCGAATQARNGKNDPYEYCKACHPGAIATQWTTERVRDAMRAWQHRYGRLPSSYDWSRTYARRRGTQALERLDAGDWPPASVVTDVFGTWKAARAAARTDT